MANETFFARFRGIIIISTICGICIPGAEKLFPFQSRSFVLAYMRLFFLVGCFNFVDGVLITLNHEVTSTLLMRTISTNAVMLWVMLTSMYLFTQQKNLKEMIKHWDQQLQPELFRAIRKEILNEHTRLTWRKIHAFACLQILPFILFYITTIWKGELMTPSILGDGLSREASRVIIIPQALSYLCWVLTYALFQCFFTLVLRLILAEMSYLQVALQSILRDLNVNTDGSVEVFQITESEEEYRACYQRACTKTYKKLKSVVEHHIQVLRFCQIAKKIYTPVVFVEFAVLTTFLCSHLYCAMMLFVCTCVAILPYDLFYCFFKGTFDQDIGLIVGVNMGVLCLITSLKCSLGENIRDMCFRLGDAAFYGNWMAYPVKIQKSLLFIIQNTRERPIQFQPFGKYPLLLITFRELTYLQYQVFMFLSEANRK